MLEASETLENALNVLPEERLAAAKACAHIVCPTMNELRRAADEAETLCSKDEWNCPATWIFCTACDIKNAGRKKTCFSKNAEKRVRIS